MKVLNLRCHELTKRCQSAETSQFGKPKYDFY